MYVVVIFFFGKSGGLNGPASQLESRRLRSLALNKCRGGACGVCAGGCLKPKGVYFVVICFFYRDWGAEWTGLPAGVASAQEPGSE